MTLETARNKLRDLAEARLSLYVREMGDEFYAKLVANKANWRVGYVPQHDEYWVIPQTAFTNKIKGEYILGPFTAIKWVHAELVALGVPTEHLDVLVAEAKELGFEQWAAA